jgi:endonuclease YncB( thermonuclease family)
LIFDRHRTVCDGKSKPKSRDRIVARCFLDKLDIAEEMAKSGTACDWPKFSGGHYDQRRDLLPEIARVAQTSGVTGHSHSISTRRRSLLFA